MVGTVKKYAFDNLKTVDDKYYAVISLGNLFEDEARFTVEFTAAVHIDRN